MAPNADDLIDEDGRLIRRAIAREILELATYLGSKAGPGSARRIRDQEKERTRVKLANAAIRGYKEALKAQEAEDIDEMYEMVKEQVEDTSPLVDIEDWD